MGRRCGWGAWLVFDTGNEKKWEPLLQNYENMLLVVAEIYNFDAGDGKG